MASDILGLFTTPEQYQLAQQQAQDAEALQFARLDPRAKASYGFYRAGQQLGDALGGALGGVDPQLQKITQRQQLLSQLDQSDPMSYRRVAKMASDAGDQQLALGIAEAGRKAESELALIQQRTKERQGADPFQQMIRTGKFTTASLAKYEASGKVGDLVLIENEAKTPAKIQEAERVALGKGFDRGTKEFDDAVNSYLERPERPEPRPSVGGDREGIALDEYDKNYYELTPAQRKVVNNILDKKRLDEAKSGATVLPGVKGVGDLVGLRKNINETVKPFRDAFNAADQAIALADDVLKTGNFASAASLSRSLAKASGETQLSKQDVASFGGDPSFVGSISDIASRLGTGTPTADTTRKLKALAVLLKKKNEALEKNEIKQLQITARISGLYTEDQIKQVFTLRGESKGKTRTTSGGISYTVDEEN